MLKRKLTIVILVFLAVDVALLMISGCKNYGVLNTIGILGAVAGVVSLAWQIRDNLLYVPKINITTEIINEKDQSEMIRIIIKNDGKSAEIVRCGLLSKDMTIIYVWITGGMPHMVRKPIPFVHNFEINEVAKSLLEKNKVIQYVFAEDSQGNIYTNDISQSTIDTITTRMKPNNS